jgi:hypothetical protein
VLAYIFLVALPILGLVAILKSGRSLTAPFSVDGSWKIESGAGHFSASPVSASPVSTLPVSTSPIAAAPCADFFSSVSNAPLSISQSGKSLVVILSGAKTAVGTLDGTTIKAQFSGADKDKSEAGQCGGDGLTLTATLDPQAEPRTLSGKLSVEGCASCAPMEFRAVRQPRPAGGTR